MKSADSGAFADTPDLFDEPALPKPATVAPDPPIDLFAHVTSQPSSENVGWATFDSSPIKSFPRTNGFNLSHKVPSSNEKFAPLTELFSADFSGPKLCPDLNSNNTQVRESSRFVNWSNTSDNLTNLL